LRVRLVCWAGCHRRLTRHGLLGATAFSHVLADCKWSLRPWAKRQYCPRLPIDDGNITEVAAVEEDPDNFPPVLDPIFHMLDPVTVRVGWGDVDIVRENVLADGLQVACWIVRTGVTAIWPHRARARSGA
jgi:hypothetical protein